MENFDALSLVIISLGAFLLPLLAEKINIPSIVLEIAYGILVGPVLGISRFLNLYLVLQYLDSCCLCSFLVLKLNWIHSEKKA